MSSHFLVCPFNENLLSKLHGKSVVIRINGIEKISAAVDTVTKHQAHLHCLLLETQAPVAAIPFQENWRDIPIALYASSLGRFPDFVRQVPTLRQLNLRVYLPLDNEENYASLRILSSLKIESAVHFRGKNIKWELITDLMTYALFGPIPHAPIAPFNYIASHYDRQRRNDYGAVYFEDPYTYLHLDENGHLALSQADLTAGKFIAQDIDEVGDINDSEEFRERVEGWRNFFLKPDGCAYCQGWRVCLGKYSDTMKGNPGCMEFFAELMESLEKYQAIKKREKIIWQP
jgi:hypothetical protein